MNPSIMALLRGGPSGGSPVDLTALINALNNIENTNHSDLVNILNALTSQDIVVFHWSNSFDPTSGAGVVAPDNKVVFGVNAPSTPGGNDEVIWVNCGRGPRNWAPLAFLFNLANNWGTLTAIMNSWNTGNGMPNISYFQPLSEDGTEIDITLTNESVESFRIHLAASLLGTEIGDNGVQILAVVNQTSQPGESQSAEGITGQVGGGPFCNSGSRLSSLHTLTSKAVVSGDFITVDIDCFFPKPIRRLVRFTSELYGTGPGSVGDGIVMNRCASWLAANTVIDSVGIALYSQASLALINFDYAQTLAAKLENCF